MISIIVPAYNEEKTLAIILDRVLRLKTDEKLEVIVIDDGSRDGTGEITKRYESRGVRLITHTQNLGKGRALKTGIRAARGDIIAVQDADMEYGPADIPEIAKIMRDNNWSVVFGSRFIIRNPTRYRIYYLGNRVLSSLVSILFGCWVTDSYTGRKVATRQAWSLVPFHASSFDVEAEITCRFLKAGYKIREIPISYSPRAISEGKKIGWKDAFQGILRILMERFS